MRFRMMIRYANGSGKPWNEDEDRPQIPDLGHAETWAKSTVAMFNKTLRPGELARELVSVEELPDEPVAHGWQKTNLVTVQRGSSMYDTYRCTQCGITGKRYGLSGEVKRDSIFKSPGYADCKKAQKLVNRRVVRMDERELAADE